jgi:NADH-quinone oxidoreductase subunit M
MILAALISVLFFGALAAWASERASPNAPRLLALVTLAVEGLLTTILLCASAKHNQVAAVAPSARWLEEFNYAWLPRFGIGFHLAADGLSLLLIALTVLLGLMAVSSSWTEIKSQRGFFYFNLLACLAGTVGVFLAVDLFVFFFFWELMLVPMFFLIALWGHENRISAAVKFFLFTQVGGLLLLLAIVALALLHHHQSGAYSFDYFDLLQTTLDPNIAFWLMLAFFIAFVVKLPSLPFHTWLPDAHTQAPTGGSVVLAGVLLKTGAYGLLRFVLPLFPQAAHQFAPTAMVLGTASIIYGAAMAFAQTDLKRLIAYTSISHMGFVLLGIFSWTLLGLQGAIITMLAHGISAAALFMIAGALQQRLHTREMSRMGGLWRLLPRLSAFALTFALASLGLPGTGNFVGEFLVLAGAFKISSQLTAVAALGLVFAPIYSLILVQKAFHGQPQQPYRSLSDFGSRELASFGLLVLFTAWLGLGPQNVLNVSAPALQHEMQVHNKDPIR